MFDDNDEKQSDPSLKERFAKGQWKLAIFVLILGVALFYYQILRHNKLADSAALYVGLPIIIALCVAMTPKAKSVTGMTLKILTIALLLSAPILQEGFICIIMASPIIYGVAAAFGGTIDHYRNKKKKGDDSTTLQTSIVSVLLAVAALEGTHEATTFECYNEVEYSRVVEANIEDVRQHIATTNSCCEKDRPVFLRLFPLPKTVEGQGIAIGDERKLHYVYNKWFYFNAHKGDTVFRVTKSDANHISFSIPHDDSYLSNYLTWQSADIMLEPLGDNKTKVKWKLAYERKLDPIWYFGPLQRYAASLTAETLIDNVADPTT